MVVDYVVMYVARALCTICILLSRCLFFYQAGALACYSSLYNTSQIYITAPLRALFRSLIHLFLGKAVLRLSSRRCQLHFVYLVLIFTRIQLCISSVSSACCWFHCFLLQHFIFSLWITKATYTFW
jgi:hypothetical protein